MAERWREIKAEIEGRPGMPSSLHSLEMEDCFEAACKRVAELEAERDSAAERIAELEEQVRTLRVAGTFGATALAMVCEELDEHLVGGSELYTAIRVAQRQLGEALGGKQSEQREAREGADGSR